MKLITIIAIIAVIIIALFAVFAFGLVDIGSILSNTGDGSTPPGGSCNYGDLDIWVAISALTGKDIVYLELQQYVDSLDMVLCHVDDMSYLETIDWYKTEYIDYTFVGSTSITGGNWDAELAIWQSATSTYYAVIAGGGAAVSAAYGHDTMVLKAHGPQATWIQFWTWVNT